MVVNIKGLKEFHWVFKRKIWQIYINFGKEYDSLRPNIEYLTPKIIFRKISEVCKRIPKKEKNTK
jgi:hypothetical protein